MRSSLRSREEIVDLKLLSFLWVFFQVRAARRPRVFHRHPGPSPPAPDPPDREEDRDPVRLHRRHNLHRETAVRRRLPGTSNQNIIHLMSSYLKNF